MKCIFLVKTKFQAYQACLICDEKGLYNNQFIVISNEERSTWEHYRKIMSQFGIVTHLAGVHRKTKKVNLIVNLSTLLWNTRQKTTSLIACASISDPLIRLFLAFSKPKSVWTFDDGFANYSQNFNFFKLDKNKTLIDRLFPRAVVEKLVENVDLHYSLRPDLPNIVPLEKVVRLNWESSARLATVKLKNKALNGKVIFLDQPLSSVLSQAEIDTLKLVVLDLRPDYFVPHPGGVGIFPKSQKSLCLGGMVIEDFLRQYQSQGFKCHLVGNLSTALFTAPSQIEKTFIVTRRQSNEYRSLLGSANANVIEF